MKTRSAVLLSTGATSPYAASRPIETIELDLAPPAPGELLVRIEAAGVCHSDLSVVDGSRPRPVPMALGHEAAGIVEEVGDDVTDVPIGSRVVLVFLPACGVCPECSVGRGALCRRGAASNAAGELLRGGRRLSTGGAPVHHHLGVSAFSELVVVDRRSAVVVDKDVPGSSAALFGCALMTGMGAVQNCARPATGESAAVFGLGGVGLAAVLAGALAGAYPIIGIDPIAHKRALAEELGATHTYAPSDDLVGAVQELTHGGVSFAVEAAGSERAMADAFAVTAPGGMTVAVGLPHPARELRIRAAELVAAGKTVVGSYMGSSAPQRDVPRLVELWRAGRLPVERLATSTVTLDEIPEAMDHLAGGAGVRQLVVPHA